MAEDVVGGSVKQALDTVWPWLDHVHMHDLAGQGYPYRELFRLLHERGYDGYMSAEAERSARSGGGRSVDVHGVLRGSLPGVSRPRAGLREKNSNKKKQPSAISGQLEARTQIPNSDVFAVVEATGRSLLLAVLGTRSDPAASNPLALRIAPAIHFPIAITPVPGRVGRPFNAPPQWYRPVGFARLPAPRRIANKVRDLEKIC